MKPNDFGKTFLVEECQKIDISSYIKTAKKNLKEALITSELNTCNTPIQLTRSATGFGGVRYWFKCPICSIRVGTLFMHPISQNIGCRGCLKLEYRARRYKGMIEDLKQE